MDWLKKAPTTLAVTVVIVCGVVALAVLGSYVALTIDGQDTTEYRQWINTIGQILVYPLIGVSAVASVQAARSASRTEDQTNGHMLRKDEEIASLQARASRTEDQTDARMTTKDAQIKELHDRIDRNER